MKTQYSYKLDSAILYPGCKLIHIVRDPRVTPVSSFRGDPTTPSWLPTTGIGSLAARQLAAMMAKIVTEFRHEDLLTKPGATMAAMLQFATGATIRSGRSLEQETAVNPARNFGNWVAPTQQAHLVDRRAGADDSIRVCS